MRRPARSANITSVTAYIAAAPPRARPMLRELRRLVRRVAPEAQEKISYRIPFYAYQGRFAYFAAFTDHVGFYMMGRTATAFAKETAKWRTSRNTLHFAFGSKLPIGLLTRILRAQKKANEHR